jgi:hypothetical protein
VSPKGDKGRGEEEEEGDEEGLPRRSVSRVHQNTRACWQSVREYAQVYEKGKEEAGKEARS